MSKLCLTGIFSPESNITGRYLNVKRETIVCEFEGNVGEEVTLDSLGWTYTANIEEVLGDAEYRVSSMERGKCIDICSCILIACFVSKCL